MLKFTRSPESLIRLEEIRTSFQLAIECKFIFSLSLISPRFCSSKEKYVFPFAQKSEMFQITGSSVFALFPCERVF